MMISSPSTSDPYAAAAALDRSLRSSSSGPADPSSGSVTLDSGPDVVVTLSNGEQSPSTYDASGKLSNTTKPDANSDSAGAPDSSGRASESDGGAATSVAPATSADSEAAAATA